MATHHPSMRDLYERLEQIGFDRTFLQRAVLPAWWRDDLAEVPSNRQLVEVYLAQGLSLDLEALQRPDYGLRLPVGNVRYKRSQKADAEKSLPTAFIARQAGEMLAEFIDLPSYQPARDALEVRQWILSNGYKQVDLRSLLDYCWAHGIIVFHLGTVSRGAHRLDGMVMFCGQRPVIMLGSGYRVPSWLAFHLAHEVAHLVRRHVAPGDESLVDLSLEAPAGGDPVEQEANRHAFAILARDFEPDVGLPPEALATRICLAAEKLGKEWHVDPGLLILVHAQKHGAWKQSSKALNFLFGQSSESAKSIIDSALWARIEDAELPEAVSRFLHAVLES